MPRLTFPFLPDGLCVPALVGRKYRPTDPGPWPEVGLGLRLWQGQFEGLEDEWLRWCDAHGEIIPTGEERVMQAEEGTRQLEERNRLLKAELQRLKGSPPM